MARAALPKLDHLTRKDFENVYEPSDDTFLLCDALENDRNFFSASKPSIVLEIGCGSGCVISFLACLLKQEGIPACCFAADINAHAALSTARTGAVNEVHVDCVLSDLAQSFVHRSVDVILFNPPYVPTPSEEIRGVGIEASWAGGVDGREVIDRFLPILSVLLAAGGRCYLVLVQENKPAQIAKNLTAQGFEVEIILKRRAVNESLQIMRIIAP